MEPKKDLIGIENLTAGEINQYLDLADNFLEVLARPIPIVPSLRGKTILTLFFEASTRTQISFSIAAKRLSADTMNVALQQSSVSKGESLIDTAKNLGIKTEGKTMDQISEEIAEKASQKQSTVEKPEPKKASEPKAKEEKK